MAEKSGNSVPGYAGTFAVTSAEWWQRLGQVFIQTGKDFFQDDGPQWAAAIAYYALLSSFPLLLALVAIATFFVDAEWAVDQVMTWVAEFVPAQQREFIAATIEDAIEARGSVGILSILGLLWGGSRVFGAVTKALNIAFDVNETYGFVKRTLVELTMLLSIGLLFIVAVLSSPIINLLSRTLGILPLAEGFLYNLLTTIVPTFLLLVSFFLIYLYVPRRTVNWQAALAGAVLATLLFVLARPLFIGYVNAFGQYNLIYGSLAVVIVLILWAWIVAVILLLGGELAAHIQDMLIEGKSAEEVEQRHRQRAPTRP